MGSFVVRHRVWVVLGWLLVAGTLNAAFPQLETVVRQQSISPLAIDSPSILALSQTAAAFDEDGTQTAVTIAMRDPAGLGSSQASLYGQLVDRLRAQPEAVLAVQDLLSNKDSRSQVVSQDGQAWYVMVGLKGTIGSPEAADSLRQVKDTTAQTFSGSTVTAYVTGPVASLGDTFEAANTDLLKIALATGVLIAAILLAIYRSVLTALLPLLVIGVSFAVARGTLSGLGIAGMPVSENSASFMTVVLLGAGTDYSVFVISRYHEAIRAGQSPAEAVGTALSGIGKVIVASAATVAVAFAAMTFNKLEVLSTSGPACAIAVLVGFAASVTLLPPMLETAGRHGIGLPGKDLTSRQWARVGVVVARKPTAVLGASLVLLIALAGLTSQLHLSYNDRTNQPSTTDSNRGYALLDEHFPKDLILPQQLVIHSPKDLRTAQGLGDLEQMAYRVSQLAGVSTVRGVTRPRGTKLDDATLSNQAGKISDSMGDAVHNANGSRGQLAQLTSGADQLDAGLRQLKSAVAESIPMISKISNVMDKYQTLIGTLGGSTAAVDRFTSLGPSVDSGLEATRKAIDMVEPVRNALAATELCTANPQCTMLIENLQALTNLRDNGFLDQLSKFRDAVVTATGASKLTDLVTSMSTAMKQAGRTLGMNSPGSSLVTQVQQMVSGIGALSDGATQLAEGVRTLVDKNIEMLDGMGQVAAALKTMRTEAAAPALSGFYLPRNAFENADFKTMGKYFVAKDGKTVRYIVESNVDPYSAAGMELARSIQTVAAQALPNTSLADASVTVIGFPSIYNDLAAMVARDFVQVVIVTVLIVAAILALLLRSVIAPLYLMATVILTYLSALGLGVAVFQWWLGRDLFWAVPPMAFIVLVAVGADYNLLLISRLRDESATNIRVGVIRTVKYTGSVITSAGLIFAASMFGLMFGSLKAIAEIGFIIGTGLLLDTFVVRTLTVPAIAVLLGKANWWPSRR
ncbi:MMPL family transporter [Mycobacterium sp. CBMA271]|nr:MMPL family transporter [Mycobacteroides sp. CBMA 271]